MTSPEPFRDRTDAGRQLAALLEPFRDLTPLILGLPRGGVVVAYEVALALEAPLDACFVRKLGAPDHPEVGMGAVAEGDAIDLDLDLVEHYGISKPRLAELVAAKRAELDDRIRRVRAQVPALDVRGRNVILVDDGIARGGTARAAMQTLRARGAARVILAVPIASPSTLDELREIADDVVCVRSEPRFQFVSAAYDDFTAVEEEEVISLLRHARMGPRRSETRAMTSRRVVSIPLELSSAPDAALDGILTMPSAARGLVIFAHGGSGRSGADQIIASELQKSGFGTLLVELLTFDEQRVNPRSPHHPFDIQFLSSRLLAITAWAREEQELATLPLGYFGESTGAVAALLAAAARPKIARAIVSLGGHLELAEAWLTDVEAPTLLIAGGADPDVLRVNREALDFLGGCERQLHVISEATHLFEEPEALEQVARATVRWFSEYLAPAQVVRAHARHH